jgi:hypothetical protein
VRGGCGCSELQQERPASKQEVGWRDLEVGDSGQKTTAQQTTTSRLVRWWLRTWVGLGSCQRRQKENLADGHMWRGESPVASRRETTVVWVVD